MTTGDGPLEGTASTGLTTVDRLDLRSEDIAASRLAELLRLFPEATGEAGTVDFDQLRRAVGEGADPGKERFGVSWPGKADCFRTIQTPSTATLLPRTEESVGFAETRNVLIEGDNLEVLKLLQKAYLGKVKLIYIDPPYNTGNDFIYPDDFAESLQTYLSYTGQVDTEGRKFSTNPETSGRFHSNWLNMMYPRLYLARNLLREDGSIFISIDDGEMANLRRMCDEIFGEENFIATIVWHKMDSPKNSAMHFSVDHDYILVYARDAQAWRPVLMPRSEEMTARYRNPDNDPRGPWLLSDLAARNYYSQGTYPITTPSGKVISGPPSGSYWRVSKERFDQLDADNRIWWGKTGDTRPGLKRFLSEVREGVVPQTIWPWQEAGSTRHAKRELQELVKLEHDENVLDSVKPSRLIRRMLQIATTPRGGDIVLDFFAGSGSTGHAVLAQNMEDGGDRRFVLVQLPEPLPTPEPGFSTLADITKARIRNAGLRGRTNGGEQQQALTIESPTDVGFRLFSLAESNFEVWDAARPADEGALIQQLQAHIEHLRPGRSELDVLFEVLLKSGFPLDTPTLELGLAGAKGWSVAEGALVVFLHRSATLDQIRSIAETAPIRVVLLDQAFAGNDQLKANAAQLFKSKGIAFKTV